MRTALDLLAPSFQVSRDGGVYERMLAKAQADQTINIGSKADQERLYSDFIKPVLQRGERINAQKQGGAPKL